MALLPLNTKTTLRRLAAFLGDYAMTKKWMDFIETGPAYVPVVRKIEVKQYGIAKVVVVRTKSNGGL